MRKPLYVGLVVTAILTLVGLLAYFQHPAGEPVAVHWNAERQADNFMSAFPAFFLMPLVALVTALIIVGWKYLEPREEHWKQSEIAVSRNILAVGIALFFAQIGIVAPTFGWQFDPVLLVGISMGIVLMVIGNVLGKTRSNFLIGIRTPWTLSSDEVWNRTNRLAGRLLVTAGILLVIIYPLVPDDWRIPSIFILVATAALIPVVYSFLLWRREVQAGKSGDSGPGNNSI